MLIMNDFLHLLVISKKNSELQRQLSLEKKIFLYIFQEKIFEMFETYFSDLILINLWSKRYS